MLKSLFTGALFGFGFALALLFVFVIYAEAFFPERYNQPARTEAPAEASPVQPETRPSALASQQLKNTYYADTADQMRFPGGGGLLLVATLDPASQPGRSDTVQIWLTKQKAWLIRTEGENVQTERLPYPKPHTVSTMRYLLQFEAPDYQSSVIYQVRKEVVRDIAADGETNAAVPTNGKLRGTTSGIVYLLPDEN